MLVCDLKVKVTDLEFSHERQNIFASLCSYIITAFWWFFLYVWHDGRYRSKVLLRAIPTQKCDHEVKVTELEFSYNSQIFCI